MCIFRDRKLLSTKRVAKKDAITAYKAVSIDHIGGFESPIQGTWWTGRKLHCQNPLGANSGTPGIHCMKSARTAREFGVVIVRVKLWGIVYEYGGPRLDSWISSVPSGGPGYLAEHVEIEAIVSSGSRYYYSYDSRVKTALARFRSLKDERPASQKK